MVGDTARRVMFHEGYFVDDAGCVIATYSVRLGNESGSGGDDWAVGVPTLVKGSRERHAIGRCGTIRVSKPERFRHAGETLISDPQEALVKRETVIEERVDDPDQMARARLIDDELNRLSTLVGSGLKTTTNSVWAKRSRTSTRDTGKNGWIWCASMEPATSGEWRRWWADLDPEYDYVTWIRSPRAFARALGVMAARQLGPRGSPITLTDTVSGANTTHPSQTVFHGSVVYVEDPFEYVAEAATPEERLLRPLFCKKNEYRNQQEYRFVIWTEEEPSRSTVDLAVSLGMLEALHGSGSTQTEQVTATGVGAAARPSAPTDLQAALAADEGPATAPGQTATTIVPGAHPPAVADRRPAMSKDEKLKVYACVGLLHKLVDLRRNEPAAANAARHSEAQIRRLCATFSDPVKSLRFADDHLLINLNVPADSETEVTIAVGPRGIPYMRTRETFGPLPARHPPAGPWELAQNTESDLRPLGLPVRERDIPDEAAAGTYVSRIPIVPPTDPHPGSGFVQVADPPPSSEDWLPVTSLSLLDMVADPAINRRPHQHDPDDDPPEDLDEKTLLYPSVLELRDLADQTGSPAAVSAAWHAETYIRRLCATFADPIEDIRIDDNCVVITIKLPMGSDTYAKIAVGPRGSAQSKIGNSTRFSITKCDGGYLGHWSMANTIESNLRSLGMPTP